MKANTQSEETKVNRTNERKTYIYLVALEDSEIEQENEASY